MSRKLLLIDGQPARRSQLRHARKTGQRISQVTKSPPGVKVLVLYPERRRPIKNG